ncbi:hypothetical protein JOF53_008241 [Crossiella equi]|uniref:AraC family transcriptional regulator n=1 Tax=Crossiella equi TaxID=130796 RepID=A0ABS5AS08_9PSEU|nr:hypothetical protein [Crossiella equi]MBP2479369.1 hypothetical protein [Crossiella equi]
MAAARTERDARPFSPRARTRGVPPHGGVARRGTVELGPGDLVLMPASVNGEWAANPENWQ